MTDVHLLRQVSGWRGKRLNSTENITLGTITEIIYDPVDVQPVFLGIRATGASRFNLLLVPFQGAVESGHAVHSSYSAQSIKEQPAADFGAGFDNAGEQQHLYTHFGITPHQDLRVLHAGDDPPGSETVLG